MIDFILEILNYKATGVNMMFTPWMMVGMGAAQMLSSYDWGGKRRKRVAKARKAYLEQKKLYRNMDITNPFEGVAERLSNFENVMEDLTVNKQQAEFEKQMLQQQQANMLSSLQGAAGSSGIAALAQAMTNQGITQAQKISASIGAQEAKNRQLQAQQASRLQQLEAKGLMVEATGEQERQAAEMSKQATLLGMDAQQLSATQQARMMAQQQFSQGIGTAMGGLMGGMGEGGWSMANMSKPI